MAVRTDHGEVRKRCLLSLIPLSESVEMVDVCEVDPDFTVDLLETEAAPWHFATQQGVGVTVDVTDEVVHVPVKVFRVFVSGATT